MMNLSATEAEQLALEFIVEDLEIPTEDQDFFAVLSSRCTDGEWYVIEVGVEGLPDKWVLQVFDTRECDPCYTFVSPVSVNEVDTGLEEFPPAIAEVVAAERRNGRS
jgi:hypothetical protein